MTISCLLVRIRDGVLTRASHGRLGAQRLATAGLVASLAVGCAASHSEPAQAPAPAPEPAAAGAPAMEMQSAPADVEDEAHSAPAMAPGGYGQQPSSKAAPAPAAGGIRADRDVNTSAAEEQSDLDALDRRLQGALQLSTPDCPSAWALRDQICDLSRRLCDLSARSAEPDMADRCTDGRTRCERATSRVRTTCAE